MPFFLLHCHQGHIGKLIDISTVFDGQLLRSIRSSDRTVMNGHRQLGYHPSTRVTSPFCSVHFPPAWADASRRPASSGLGLSSSGLGLHLPDQLAPSGLGPTLHAGLLPLDLSLHPPDWARYGVGDDLPQHRVHSRAT